MNWTGGQLRRHSARKGILSKTQRKKFAKSRQLVNDDRLSRQVISFPSFLDRRGKQTKAEQEKTSAVIESQISSVFARALLFLFYHWPSSRRWLDTDMHPTSSSPLLNTSHETFHKHRLLQSSDWAVVCLSCPLDIKFTPVEEFEQFGKRRKLNDTDHKRLSTQAGKTTRGLFQSRVKARRLSSERGISSLNQIQIHIDGRPTCPHPHSDVSSENPPSRCLSQSILLGHQTAIEDPRLSAQLHEQTRPQNRWQKLSAYNPGSHKLTKVPKTPSTIPETVILQNTQFVTPSRVTAQPSPFQYLNHPTASSYQHARQTITLPAPTNPLPPRHSTVDNAVLTKPYPNIDYDTDQQTTSRSSSLVSTLIAFPSMNETQVSASQIPSRGTLQPREINDRVTDNPSQVANNTGSSQRVRISGQLVRLNTEAEVHPLKEFQ